MKRLIGLVVLLSVVMLPAFLFAASTLEEIIKRGKIIVATDMTAVPMQYRDPSGKPTGFTIELMELAAKYMGVEIEWNDMAWESLIPSLLTKKVDMIAANMSMTLTRLKTIRFSDPFFLTGIRVLARKDSKMVSWKDIADPSVKIGATMGSVHADYIEKQLKKKPFLYENLAEWLNDLKKGRIDAVMDDEMLCIELVKNNPELKILEGYVRPDTYGFAFRQDPESDSLVNWFNWFIKWIKLTGEYGEIYKKYTGMEWSPSPIID